MTTATGGVQLPTNQQAGIETLAEPADEPVAPIPPTPKQAATIQNPATSAQSLERPETPSTQDLPSESAQSTSPTTPASTHATNASTVASTTPTRPTNSASKASVPAVPVVPILPRSSPKDTRTAPGTDKVADEQKPAPEPASEAAVGKQDEPTAAEATEAKVEHAPAPVRAAPKSWASLVAGNPSAAAAAAARNSAANTNTNGTHATDGSGSGDAGAVPGFAKSNASSQAEALHNFRVNNGSKFAFLEPRGLINTGNMCYMNSVSYGGSAIELRQLTDSIGTSSFNFLHTIL